MSKSLCVATPLSPADEKSPKQHSLLRVGAAALLTIAQSLPSHAADRTMECKLRNVRSGEASYVRIQWNGERLTHIEGNDTKVYDNRVERGSRYYFQLNDLRAEWGFVDVDTSAVIYKYILGLKDGEIQFFFKDYANMNAREPQLLSEGKCNATP